SRGAKAGRHFGRRGPRAGCRSRSKGDGGGVRGHRKWQHAGDQLLPRRKVRRSPRSPRREPEPEDHPDASGGYRRHRIDRRHRRDRQGRNPIGRSMTIGIESNAMDFSIALFFAILGVVLMLVELVAPIGVFLFLAGAAAITSLSVWAIDLDWIAATSVYSVATL